MIIISDSGEQSAISLGHRNEAPAEGVGTVSLALNHKSTIGHKNHLKRSLWGGAERRQNDKQQHQTDDTMTRFFTASCCYDAPSQITLSLERAACNSFNDTPKVSSSLPRPLRAPEDPELNAY